MSLTALCHFCCFTELCESFWAQPEKCSIGPSLLTRLCDMGCVPKRAYAYKHLASCRVLLVSGDLTGCSARTGGRGSAGLFRTVITCGFRGITQ